MNTKRLEDLIDMLEEIETNRWVATDTPHPVLAFNDEITFDLEAWCTVEDSETSHCGFSACVVGHAMIDARFEELTPEPVDEDMFLGFEPAYQHEGYRETGWMAVGLYFGIKHFQARWLFSDEEYAWADPTPRDVAHRVREFITSGGEVPA